VPQHEQKTENAEAVIAVIRQRIAERGQAALERQMGIGRGGLSHVVSRRKAVSTTLAAKFGFDAVLVYRRQSSR